MDEKFLKPYNPSQTEEKIYALWEESGFFNPDMCIQKGVAKQSAPTFSMVLPPPNVTGVLHMGHAAMLAIEDIMIRYHRMKGFRTLWVPGTDSAAIATQSKVEDIVYKKEKKTRHDLGREELLRRVGAFAEESKNTIINQTKRMGSSLDWSRYAYTLDEERYRAVMEAFVRMYEKGLIFRGARIVNWDPNLQTTVSDDEIERIPEQTAFYYLKYGPFTIGTARPETKFGDKYVVMHPSDKRYSKYKHGDTLEVEWINGSVTATIIKDEAVDMDFGTGVMTITPWHDATDFEIAERHKLDKEQVIDWHGKLLPIAGEFAGIHIKKARPLIIEKMKEKGLLQKIDTNYELNLATNHRGGGIIEPQIKEQWFVDVQKEFALEHSNFKSIPAGEKTNLKKLMRAVVEKKEIEIIPDRFSKTYFQWIDNLHNWCISRQIWYGHRIPVWYRKGEIYCGLQAPQGEGWEQDPDTLDTWFSSGLWTFSTLGWPAFAQSATAGKPGIENDFANYHPTSVLETGYDILFFWVARMILMSGFLIGDVPFKKVYLHGLVRDEKGRKMSKSLGNIIDPLAMIEKCGADATRLSLVIGTPPGNDNALSEDKVRGYKYFANKVWNIARFVLSNTAQENLKEEPSVRAEDRQWLTEADNISKQITEYIDDNRFDLAADELYQWLWKEFADKYIESIKPVLQNGSESDRQSVEWTLYHILQTLLKLLHPFMPYVTEEIWQSLPQKEAELLMVARWPYPQNAPTEPEK